MLAKVPCLISEWLGTGTVTVVSADLSCMMTWLPDVRTSENPFCRKILHTSLPESRRSLPNGYLDAGDEDFAP